MTVIDINHYREARAALEVQQDLQSVAACYGYDLTVMFTAEGVSATLTRDGFRALSVQPCRDVQTAGNRVMCWLEARSDA
ncbi:hypothetical protein SEA_PHABULOSO_65 [Gordonia phage Phabuloso]|nr:hypothetical protein SEA_PHABULOSO_65 [Gordonia phage Phabuloso]